MSVVADPAKLRELGKKIKGAGETIEQAQKQILGALRSSGWDDAERQRFEDRLTQELRAVVAIAKRLQSDYPQVLERKARALDDFRR